MNNRASNRKPMTVGDLLKALADVEDLDMPVVIADDQYLSYASPLTDVREFTGTRDRDDSWDIRDYDNLDEDKLEPVLILYPRL